MVSAGGVASTEKGLGLPSPVEIAIFSSVAGTPMIFHSLLYASFEKVSVYGASCTQTYQTNLKTVIS